MTERKFAQQGDDTVICPRCSAYRDPFAKCWFCGDKPMRELVFECGGCGRAYNVRFPECPFCYVQEFLEVEATDGECPVCGEVHRSVCPECDKTFGEHDTYCMYCGFIRNQPLTSSDEMKARGY